MNQLIYTPTPNPDIILKVAKLGHNKACQYNLISLEILIYFVSCNMSRRAFRTDINLEVNVNIL